MSILSKIKSSKKAADDHKAATAAKTAAASNTSPPKPYRHVPRHAAQDALAGTPGVADRNAILEANQARATYAQHSFYSTSSPSLARSYSSDGLVASASTSAAARSAAPSRSMSRSSSSRVGTAFGGPRIDRKSHPGYGSYQSGTAPPSPQHSRRGSGHRSMQQKSPLSSEPITPMDSSASSSSRSSFSTRGYNDPIEHTLPLSQRLEDGLAPPVEHQTTRRPALYTAKTTGHLKPWEVAARKRAALLESKQPEATVSPEIVVQTPKPTVAKPAQRGRFLGFSGKQQTVAAF